MSTRDLEEKQKFLLELVSHAAMFKLKLNEHRGDITEMSIKDALFRAKEEISELEGCFVDIEEGGYAPLSADPESVLMEAADTLNFLLVAVSKAYEAKKEKKRVQYR